MENQGKNPPNFRGFVRYDLSITRDGISSSQNYQREIFDPILALGWIVDSWDYRNFSVKVTRKAVLIQGGFFYLNKSLFQ
jgi:hypothetical protein